MSAVLTMVSFWAVAQAGSSLPIIAHSSSSVRAAMVPEGVLKLSPDEQFILWVELAEGRLSLLEQQANGGLVVRKVIPVSIGRNGFGKEHEGDKRTPVGVYHFTSFFKDTTLRDYYGLGAYPLNYPNVLDRRLNRTGSGIWLHGLPKGIDQRPLFDSDGCVVIDNTSLEEMANFIKTGMTHIVLSENEINWLPVEEVEAKSATLEGAFENWRQAWESRDNDLYLSFYADNFSTFSRDRNQWDNYKRQVNNSKSTITVDVSKLSFFAGSEASDIVTVRYYQRYQSSNYNWNGWKEQLWQEQNNQWQIIYEGNG